MDFLKNCFKNSLRKSLHSGPGQPRSIRRQFLKHFLKDSLRKNFSNHFYKEFLNEQNSVATFKRNSLRKKFLKSEYYQSLWFYKIKFTERVRKDCMKTKYSKFYLFWKIYWIHINALYIGKTIWKFWSKDLMVKYIEVLIIKSKIKITWALRRRKG